MTSANEAFEKLLGKNALGIPVANPAPEARSAEGPSAASVPFPASSSAAHMPAHNGSAAGDMSEALRVLDLIDENGGDYSPPHDDDGDDGNGAVFATPTETELEAVDGGPVPTPRGGTRRVVDLEADTVDSDAVPETETDVNVIDDGDDEGAADGNGGAQADAGGEAGLRKARRFRRFSYLPLGGMEHFENRARDIMAGLASQEPDQPSLAVAGPSRGDGQTEFAIRLALAMAKRVDYRVLLADFDVRKPEVAKRLGLSSKYFTLADVLRGSCPLGEALMASEEDNLYVLPARASDRDGDEVLNDKQVQALMAKIHANFDFAVISCGAADSADAAIVCRHAGAAALAGRCGRTTAKALRDAADRLADAGANVAGMLLTGA